MKADAEAAAACGARETLCESSAINEAIVQRGSGMSKRMKTGIEGLDAILDGGFLYHNSILVKGEPGAGKTTLGIQIIYNGVTLFDEPGIIVLFEQFPQQLFRDLKSYEWDVEGLVQAQRIAVLFARIEDIAATSLVSDAPLVSAIHTAAAEIGARRILIDGVSHFLKMIDLQRSEREVFLKFLNEIKSMGLTPILTAEAGGPEPGYEDYLTDCLLTLTTRASKDPTFLVRQLEVKKTRGHRHVRGRHPYRITGRGIEVFPNMPPRAWDGAEDVSAETTRSVQAGRQPAPALARLSSGVNGLDEMLCGGLTRGTATIVAGMPGTYKTTLAVQFLNQGAVSGRPGLIVSFAENPRFLVQTMKDRGIDLEPHLASGLLKIWHRFPKHFYVEELMRDLDREFTRAGGAQLLVVDSINDLERGIEDPATYKDYITTLYALLARRGVTSLFIQKLDCFTANAPLTNIRYASLFDGVIYLGAVEIESAMHKVISVLKMRGGDYLGDLREITCGRNGLHVLDKFVGMTGILAGNAQGQYKRTVEEILQPLYFIRDFLDIMAAPDTDESMRAEIKSNLVGEVNKLLDKLCRYFDIKPGG
ncbi:MAG: circadian clock protein KaiC [Candidatus Sumerlaeia bacterium]